MLFYGLVYILKYKRNKIDKKYRVKHTVSCERACPVSPLEPVVRWRQSTFSIIFFAIASK